MKRATLTETKNNLSQLVDQARKGESVIILDRDVPAARLESIVSSGKPPEGRQARLERAGIVRPPRISPAGRWLSEPSTADEDGGGVLEALLEERRSGR